MFVQSLERNDIVIGVVTSVIDSGLLIALLCLDNGRARDVDDLKIMVRYLSTCKSTYRIQCIKCLWRLLNP